MTEFSPCLAKNPRDFGEERHICATKCRAYSFVIRALCTQFFMLLGTSFFLALSRCAFPDKRSGDCEASLQKRNVSRATFEFPGCLHTRFANLAAKVHSRLGRGFVCRADRIREGPQIPKEAAICEKSARSESVAPFRDFGTGSPFRKPEGYLRPEDAT